MLLADASYDSLTLAAGCVTLAIIFFLALAVLIAIYNGTINLSALISEKDGATRDASMSRFQLLIFTFVIAISLFLIVTYQKSFPEVPQGVLVLLGISGSSYLVSKGIQKSGSDSSTGVKDGGAAKPGGGNAGAGNAGAGGNQ